MFVITDQVIVKETGEYASQVRLCKAELILFGSFCFEGMAPSADNAMEELGIYELLVFPTANVVTYPSGSSHSLTFQSVLLHRGGSLLEQCLPSVPLFRVLRLSVLLLLLLFAQSSDAISECHCIPAQLALPVFSAR